MNDCVIKKNNSGWHYLAKVVHNCFGKKTLYLDGKTGSYLPDICFDEIRVSAIARSTSWIRAMAGCQDYITTASGYKIPIMTKKFFVLPPYTIEAWMRIGFSLKHWTYAQRWSFSQCIKKYTVNY